MCGGRRCCRRGRAPPLAQSSHPPFLQRDVPPTAWYYDNRDNSRDFQNNGFLPGDFAADPPAASIGAAGIFGFTPAGGSHFGPIYCTRRRIAPHNPIPAISRETTEYGIAVSDNLERQPSPEGNVMTNHRKCAASKCSPATPAGETTISSRSPPKTAWLAGVNSTRVLALPASARRSSGCRRAWSDRTLFSMSASMPSCSRRPAPPPAAWSRRRLARSKTRCSTSRAKLLGVPCYELLGGKIRDRIRVYWSHCATWRINHPDLVQAGDHRS